MDIKEYMYFRRTDRRAIGFVIFCIAAVIIALHQVVMSSSQTAVVATDTVYVQKTADSSMPYHGGRRISQSRYRPYNTAHPLRFEYFPFDPNTADSTTLLRLGLSPWQVRSIYRYRAKGGIYRQPEDFARLYGLTVQQYRRLAPYIRISSDYAPASTLIGKAHDRTASYRDTLLYPVKLRPTEHVVLNLADTTMLKKVPGIGSGWARVIVRYGERLGGYTDVAQLREIDGFPEEAISYFIISNPNPRKLNLNQLSLNALRNHPYINFYQARAVCDYRRLRGKIDNLDQLRLLKEFSGDAIERLAPYVEF